ncbi:hypothetical protein CKO25_09140 [Thiocapsa imhoffii]|uniref:Uncharacterized protein n=1 Tax=Thiocapsa imhoffii TaxID=382777 RepID=A0A9X1B987_9GAMM|nr:hypothetical protein [Thiocapsa imhoffii]MBK1644810.1 hypothetical protein [Thiocapsa imhoffii]
MSNLASFKKSVDALSRALKSFGQEQSLTLGERDDALKEARQACANIDLAALIQVLDDEQERVAQELEQALSSRRETLLKAAREQSFPHKRFTDYDYLGPFKVSYKGRMVLLEVGSERFDRIDEADGASLFKLIRQRAKDLDDAPFVREVFFQTLKDAIRFAKSTGQDQNGQVPIRTLYPLVVLARHSRSESFLKKPEQRSFDDYPLPQFLYDLARFGRDGWRCGEELLRTQTPNMATISQGKTLMLPALAAQDGSNHRIAMLWIEKREG